MSAPGRSSCGWIRAGLPCRLHRRDGRVGRSDRSDICRRSGGDRFQLAIPARLPESCHGRGSALRVQGRAIGGAASSGRKWRRGVQVPVHHHADADLRSAERSISYDLSGCLNSYTGSGHSDFQRNVLIGVLIQKFESDLVAATACALGAPIEVVAMRQPSNSKSAPSRTTIVRKVSSGGEIFPFS